MTQEAHIVAFGGGLDLVTPAMSKPEGKVIISENYEPRPEGYRRINGIERFDGKPQPHLASYSILKFGTGVAAISEGNTVTGATSGATGKALTDAVIESGAYGTNNANGYLVLSEITGTFQDNENLQVLSATKVISVGLALENRAVNDGLDATYSQDSIETRRALINVVTGSGDIRGVWRYNGVVYAFRDNAGGTAVNMWKSTSAGWVQCDLGFSVAFTSGGTTEIAESNVIQGATSGATATVKRVILISGTWAGGDAAGRLILYSQTGTFVAENIGVSAANHATISANSSANVLAAGGRYEFINHNFYGGSGTERMYGVDGVSKGFEWDGLVFVPIETGMETDAPSHLAAHKNHLFFMYAGGSAQHSGIGDPYVWTIISGAGEIGIGDTGTGFNVASGVLIIYGRNNTNILYGNDASDWTLQTLSQEAGAIEWSPQNVGGRLVHADTAGIRDLNATQAYGDFSFGNLSVLSDPWLKSKRIANVSLIATTFIKSKNQYRAFYSDGYCLVLDMTTGKPQFLTINYGVVVKCTASVEDADGEEWILFGSTDGYIYRAEVGTSLDGASLTSFLRLPFNHMKSARVEKRYHSVEVELEAGPNTTLSVMGDFAYGNPDISSQNETALSVKGGGGFWGESNWSEFYWGSQYEGQGKAYLEGIGQNASLVFASTATYEEPHTLHGAAINYSYRKLKR
tara:strand:- start:892 stop:2961 length:2070 start_codon:yes stop_codon:yes gene_type:complete